MSRHRHAGGTIEGQTVLPLDLTDHGHFEALQFKPLSLICLKSSMFLLKH